MQRIYRGYPQALHMAEIEQQLYQGAGFYPGMPPVDQFYGASYGAMYGTYAGAQPAGWAEEEQVMETPIVEGPAAENPEVFDMQAGIGNAEDPAGALQPYMVYRGTEQQELIDRPQALKQELEYFKSLYPMAVKKRQVLVDEVCDQMEYHGSPMYDEYPDRVSVYRIRDGICARARDAGMDEEKDLTLVLLVNEWNRRRVLKKV